MILFEYTASSFSQVEFEKNGSFVAVVLNYNKAGLIGKAAKSAFSQDWPCYEILAMDDSSTDGSDVEMLNMVKECVGEFPDKALKVTVVRNEVNLSTLGQWRQAVKLSSGKWFGMFCGDDESTTDRLSVADELIQSHPDAIAVCTNFNDSGSSSPHYPPGFFVKTTGDYGWNVPHSIMGCTAFWRRDVLELDLPDGTMDDFILTWLAIISKKGSLVWNFNRSTVSYGVGTGVTTVDRCGVADNDDSILGLYGKYKAVLRRGRRFGRNVWGKIKQFDDKFGSDKTISRQVRGYWISSLSEGGGWVDRLKALLMMLVVDTGNDYGGLRPQLVKKVAGRFVTRFFGAASFVGCYCVAAKIERLRRNG